MRYLSLLLLLGACGHSPTEPNVAPPAANTSTCLRWGWVSVDGLPYLVPACLEWSKPFARP